MKVSNANSRSASLSSTTTSSHSSSSSKTEAGIKKKFGCNFPGCGKSFSRSEHLHRHALNHKDGNNTCMRCMAHFRRRDLLDRHMARHKEKDDEAGGEGLGILATRKRLWRDADGNIVNARRPSYTPDGAATIKRRQLSRAGTTNERCKAAPARCGPEAQSDDQKHQHSRTRRPISLALPTPTNQMSRAGSPTSSTIIVDSGLHHHVPSSFLQHGDEKDHEVNQDSWLDMPPALPSPPLSSPSSADQSPSAEIDDLDTLYEDSWPTMHNGLPEIINNSPVLGRTSEYPDTPSWGPQPFQTFMGAVGELPYEDLFRSSTAASEQLGMYEWSSGAGGMGWAGGVSTMSRCREEKFDPFASSSTGVGMEKRDLYPEALLRRGFGMGAC